VYQGVYGPWSVDAADIAEVQLYRAGISLSSVSLLAGAATMIGGLPAPAALLNAECVAASLGLGLSLKLIHLYVSEIKLVFQSLWALGTAGGAWLMLTHLETPLPVFVAEHSWAALCVGPFFAAITGVAIKEGLCYGKAEAAALALVRSPRPPPCVARSEGLLRESAMQVTPLWMGGHLTGLLPRDAETVLAAAFTLIFTIFSARKFTQAIKDDIGDKSVFECAFLGLCGSHSHSVRRH